MAGIRDSLKAVRGGNAVGAALTAVVGLCFLIFPIGWGLTDLSYELPFIFHPTTTPAGVMVVYMDEHSEARLGQGRWDRFDRSIHARLIETLTKAGAKAVIFDVQVWPAGTNRNANQKLEAAVRAHGKVAFGAKRTERVHDGIVIGFSIDKSYDELTDIAPWGLVEAGDDERMVREHIRDKDFVVPSLAWRVAEMTLSGPPPPPFAERWIHYYGPPGCLSHTNYFDALSATPATAAVFSNQVVFVGAQWGVGFSGGRGTDDFRTPFTRWTGRKSPGVEVIATTYLNLVQGDWLRRWPPLVECVGIVLAGLALAFGLAERRPFTAAALAFAAASLVTLGAVALVGSTQIWFPWLIIVAVQIPLALAWSLLTQASRLWSEKRVLEQRLAFAARVTLEPGEAAPGGPSVDSIQAVRNRVVEAAAIANHAATPKSTAHVPFMAPIIPDHELLTRIGHGAYGEVWLARDIIGTFHAVKIVSRLSFQDAAPYEREFKGIRHFTPLSRQHPGLIQILHVGRNTQPEYIYCVMEVADDEASGQIIDPRHYSPRNLAKELKRRRRLRLTECLDLGVALADALGFLHRQGLIHRDIKPSNIVFVRGAPKFADIGLVTTIALQPSDVSYLGTRGYIAPEGPGTPSADVYSLGKVLYEMATGLDSTMFPDLPKTLVEKADEPDLFRLNALILKACENDPVRRYQSADEFRAALAGLRAGDGGQRTVDGGRRSDVSGQ